MEAASNLIDKFVKFVIDPIMLVLFAAGFFLFMYGVVEFLLKLNSGGDTKEGKQHMMWGIIGMFIMMSVQGIIFFLTSSFGIDISGNAFNVNSVNSVSPGLFFK